MLFDSRRVSMSVCIWFYAIILILKRQQPTTDRLTDRATICATTPRHIVLVYNNICVCAIVVVAHEYTHRASR